MVRDIYFESLAGAHLMDGIDALRDAGSPDALYDRFIRATKKGERSDTWLASAITVAFDKSFALCRRATLVAAFAAEAYVNEFLYAHVGATDRDALDRLPTLDKYVIVPKVALGHSPLERGSEPMQTLQILFKRRDTLVHPKPRTVAPEPGREPDQYNPVEAAKLLIAVADAAWTLREHTPDGNHPNSAVTLVREGRKNLLAYAKQATEQRPGPDDPPAVPYLLIEAARPGSTPPH